MKNIAPLLACFCLCLFTPPAFSGQTAESFKKEQTKTLGLDYLLYLPPEYIADTTGKKWPLILFLHGSGERGNDLNKVKVHGPPKIVENKDLGFIVVSPQCPPGQWWDVETLSALLDEVESKQRVDAQRIYVTGLSMGGFGTWDLAAHEPQRFAAIAPICGGGEPIHVKQHKHVPTWVFHGAKDGAVPIARSEQMVEALKKQDADVTFTVYPEAGHDSWTESYNNPKLYEWFLSHERK
jgi:predicted peptidase